MFIDKNKKATWRLQRSTVHTHTHTHILQRNCNEKILTGMLEFSFAPPIKPPLWKFFGQTSDPNLCSWSLFHTIFFLLTSKALSLTEKPYVSLNKLHATRPQGTIGAPLAVTASGLQASVLLSLALLLNCFSLRLFTYLDEIFTCQWQKHSEKSKLLKEILSTIQERLHDLYTNQNVSTPQQATTKNFLKKNQGIQQLTVIKGLEEHARS